MEIAPRITVDPNIVHGAAVIKGTRIPVSLVVGSLGSGMTAANVITEYGVTQEDIDAALAHGSQVTPPPTSPG